MEITREQVEKVRGCTGASFEEAKAALERSGGVVLDAVIDLERREKGESAQGSASTQDPDPPRGPGSAGRRRVDWPQVARAAKSLVVNCLTVTVEVWKDGRVTCVIPLLIAVVLCVVEPALMLALLLAGLCFGYRVHLAGRGTEEWGDKVNEFFDRAGDTAHDAVSSLGRDRGRKKG